MTNKIRFTGMLLFSFILLNSCQDTNGDEMTKETTAKPVALIEKVLSAEEQKALTPEMIIESLKDGNKRFMNNSVTARDHSAMVRNAAPGQYPKAVVLSCLDSRIPVEDVFDKGIGDLFICRIAGNIINEDLLGSMEYGCKISGSKLILVMGHESCGAIKAAIDHVELGNITALLAKVNPAIINSESFTGEHISKNKDYVEIVANNNVKNSIEAIKAKSPILKAMADKGEIKIIGAYYNLSNGEVIFIKE